MVGLYPARGADCFSLFGLKVLPEPTKADERKVKAVSFFLLLRLQDVVQTPIKA